MSAVDLVHRQLEFLKYVGGRRDADGRAVPSGQGTEVDIVLMPDLLLDIREYNFDDRHARIMAVGGRAARMACALMHLLGEDDGTFQVHLLTKTGRMGRLLLENEFDSGPAPRSFPGPFFEYILPREGVLRAEPRFAIRQTRESAARSSERWPETEVSVQDLDRPEVDQMISRARTICFTAVRNPGFRQIFEILLTSASKHKQAVFLDTRRTRESLSELSDFLRALPVTRRAKITGIFLRRDEEGSFLEAFRSPSVGAAAEELLIPIVEYGSSETKIAEAHLPEGNPPITCSCQASADHEGIAECFKAGVVLARTVYETVGLLSAEFHEIGQRLQGEWRTPDHPYWRTVLEYAVAIAERRSSTGNEACRLSDLLEHARAKEDHLTEQEHEPKNCVKFAAGPPAGSRTRRLSLSEAATDRTLAKLAGRRRTAQVGSRALECLDLPLCESGSESCRAACTQQNRPSPLAAVLIDLDSTLLDSPGECVRALSAALPALQKESPATPEHIKLFRKHIYDWHRLYKELDLGDFRQEWNHEGWYIAFIAYTRNPSLLDTPRNRVQGDPPCWNVGKDGAASREKKDWQDHFLAAYGRIATEFKSEIAEARNRFRQARIYPFKEARDFLRSLSMTGSIGLYVVSEGNPDAQWDKLCRIGLAEFFGRERVLTTGDAVESATVRESLRRTRARLEANEAALRTDRIRTREFMDQVGQLENKHLEVIGQRVKDAKNRDLTQRAIQESCSTEKLVCAEKIVALDAQIARLKAQEEVVRFIQHVLDRMRKKGVLTFYACAIRAILRDPSNPRSKLVHFEELIKPSDPLAKLKFAIIGDRQTNDIDPPQLLMGDRIVTLRLNSLEYSIKEPPEKAKYPPDFVADTLAQAKAILLTKETWSKQCATDPPIFDLTVETEHSGRFPARTGFAETSVRIELLECGCRMLHEDSYIARICAGILVEHLVRAPEDERFLENYLGGHEDDWVTARDRVCLLAAIERTGAIYDGPLIKFQTRLARQLIEDATAIDDDIPEHMAAMAELRTSLQNLRNHGTPETREALASEV